MDRVSERVAEQMAAFRLRRAHRRAVAAEFAARRQYGLKLRHATRLGLEQQNAPAESDRGD